MRKESDQAARALTEQTRAMRDVLDGTQNISEADRPHYQSEQAALHQRAARVLSQLKDVRTVTERNARAAKDTQGGTGDLLRHAEALTGALASHRNGSNGAGMSRIGILTTDTDLVVTTWDAALERMTGIAADTARGRRLDDIVPDIKRRG